MKAHIDKIDFLRGIAILLVFVYHASLAIFGLYYKTYAYSGFWLNYKSIPKIDLALLFTPASFGGSGVSLFLIISGFLIHYGTIKKNKFEPLLFFNKRFWRIWPPYLVALVLFFVFKGPRDSINFFTHLFLVHNLKEETIFGINPSFWSLALEMQLYIIYPAYLFIYNKLGNNKSLYVIAAISIAALLIQVIFKIESQVYDKSIFKYWIIWVAGAYLAHVFHNNKRVSNTNGIQLTVFLALIVLSQLTVLYNYLGFYLLAIFYVLLIDWMLHSNINISTSLYKFIISIGLCSYSIYLFHQPYLYELINLIRFGFYSFLMTTPLCFFILYFIARLSHRFVELPSIAFGNNLYALKANFKINSADNP